MKGVLYYITSKSGHEQELFADDSDYRQYISLIDAYKKQYTFKLFSYVLMPDHLHMLIEPTTEAGISNIMHDINSLYTKAYNSRYNKKGHLFQERFRAVLAEKERYLLPLARHINIHPKTEKAVNDPKDYPYSSYAKFLDPAKRQNPDMTREIDEVFGMLHGRGEAFEKYVADVSPEEISDFKKLVEKKRILGSKEFSDEVKRAMEETARQHKKYAGMSKRQFIYVMVSGIAVLILAVTVGYNYRREHIALMGAYDKTLQLYDSTLRMLKQERDDALQSNRGAGDYAWKIGLVENAVEKLQQEKKELDGYSWDITLTQVSGSESSFAATDTLVFENNRLESVSLSREGFSASTYSKREPKGGAVSWDTIQTNSAGETASWHGKWNGKIMRGILSRRSADGIVKDFSFASADERMKR